MLSQANNDHITGIELFFNTSSSLVCLVKVITQSTVILF